jgi:hypothetical protein
MAVVVEGIDPSRGAGQRAVGARALVLARDGRLQASARVPCPTLAQIVAAVRRG